ncbi:MAG: class I SAM-dependent methyltransferase [Candidatus Brocadiaceae bacterium]|nr:class I SAM-dependent methyltransferase [Candidatus Brocadiaceae bacterium]
MNTKQKENVFNRSGLAALSDLKNLGYQNIFSLLEKEQDVFLIRESEFRSKEYKWPRDPLHTWSRVWEYPYVYYHMRKNLVHANSASLPKVVDLGSGVTFFPFIIASLGYEVICLDIDAVCSLDIERALSVLPQQQGKVNFRLIADYKLPLKSNEVDLVYSVSVMEHIHDFENTIEEVFRILKIGGLFILTIDLDLCGYLDIDLKRYYKLRECLFKYFDLIELETTVHPLDILHSQNGPFPLHKFSSLKKMIFHMKQQIKPLFGKRPFVALPNLAVWGGIFIKRRN